MVEETGDASEWLAVVQYDDAHTLDEPIPMRATAEIAAENCRTKAVEPGIKGVLLYKMISTYVKETVVKETACK